MAGVRAAERKAAPSTFRSGENGENCANGVSTTNTTNAAAAAATATASDGISARRLQVLLYVLSRAGYIHGYKPDQSFVQAHISHRLGGIKESSMTGRDWEELREAHAPFFGQAFVPPESMGLPTERIKREANIEQHELLTGKPDINLEKSGSN
jgi:hypothetical protein